MLSLMKENGKKFKERLTCGFKYDIRNWLNFYPTTQKSRNFSSMCSFWRKYIRLELGKYRWGTFHDAGQWYKIRINSDLLVSKWHDKLGKLSLDNLKVWKLYLRRCFCPNDLMFRLENFRGIMCHVTERWLKI